MQLALFSYILHFVNLTKGLDNAKILRHRRSSSVGRQCPSGCTTCSAMNGCLSCKPRLFFHMELDGMRQKGTCLSFCPRGYYGMRSPRISTCTRCEEDCDSCFSEHFCTHCHPGHFLFLGKCQNSCPSGLTADKALRECTALPSQCIVRMGNGHTGVHVFRDRAPAPTGGGRSHAPDKFYSPQVCSDPCPHACQRSGRASLKTSK